MALYDSSVLINSTGAMRTTALFKETASKDENPIFTLSNNPKEGYVTLKDIYMDFCVLDPTEVTFADHVFGSWTHWKKISNSNFFQDYILEWREEAAVRRKSLAFKAMIKDVQEGKNTLVAGKYLIEEPWLGKSAKAMSSRHKTTREARLAVDSDIQRLKEAGMIQ